MKDAVVIGGPSRNSLIESLDYHINGGTKKEVFFTLLSDEGEEKQYTGVVTGLNASWRLSKGNGSILDVTGVFRLEGEKKPKRWLIRIKHYDTMGARSGYVQKMVHLKPEMPANPEPKGNEPKKKRRPKKPYKKK